MFDRAKYKKFARMQLKGRWKIPVVITIISSLILAVFVAMNYSVTPEEELSALSLYDVTSQSLSMTSLLPRSTVSILEFLIAAILTFAGIHVYLKMSRSPEPVKFSDFIEGFSYWLKAILTSVYVNIFITLWTLLFIIPGIVKSFAYSQTKYLVLEFPKLSISKANRISMELTKGYKWDIFLTFLSFLPWMILCCLTCGIGFFWLGPYINMTMTNVYHALLTSAIESKRITPEDLEG